VELRFILQSPAFACVASFQPFPLFFLQHLLLSNMHAFPLVWSHVQFNIDPMQLPEGMDDELELLDDLEVRCKMNCRDQKLKQIKRCFTSTAVTNAARTLYNV
jgi:hypothetical protein